MEKIFSMLEHMSFFAGLGAVAATVGTIFLYIIYSEKNLPPETKGENLDKFWYFGIFVIELYGYAMPADGVELNLFLDSLLLTIFEILGNAIIFFICYGVLTLIGVDKEIKFERCKKAFMGLVILSFAMLLLYEEFLKGVY